MTPPRIPDEAPTAGWDIHCHTVFSDGTETPQTLAGLVVEKGLHGVAITDHDTSNGWPEMLRACRTAGMPVLLGTEVTADDEGVSVHVLAFLYDPSNPAISGMFRRTREARLGRARRMTQLLAKDFPITWDAVLAQARQGDSTTVGRPHLADALVAAGVYPTRSDAFSGALASSSPYYIPTPSPTTHEVVRAVKAAGGVSVVAHAGDRGRNRHLLTDAQIESLADDGLDGLEVWHRGNGPDQRQRLLAIAHRRGLLVTGGSDWHGSGKPNQLGENLTDDGTVGEIMYRGVPVDRIAGTLDSVSYES